jgi:hypothetical protein
MKKIGTRLRVLEMVTEIAAEAAQNNNVIGMIEFQEELVERLFRKMVALIDEETDKEKDSEPSKKHEPEEEDEDESQS